MRTVRSAFQRRLAWTWALPALLGLGLWGAPQAARAASFTVANTNNAGTGSLRQAVADAAASADASDTITFDPATFGTTPRTITLTTGEIVIGKSLTVTGPGAALVTVNGGGIDRVFEITAGTVGISDLTITGGDPGDNGGGVYVDSGASLTLDACALTDNTADDGDGDGDGGAVYGDGNSLTLTNCTLTDNFAGNQGGGVYLDSGVLAMTGCTVSGNEAGNNAGGVVITTPLLLSLTSAAQTVSPAIVITNTATLTNCTISNNTGDNGGGAGLDVFNGARVLLTSCTVSNNASNGTSGGGGILVAGGGVGTVATLDGCTVSGNQTNGSGGGVYVQTSAELILTNTTVSGNTAYNTSDSATEGGGGVYNQGTLTATDSTLSGNIVGGGIIFARVAPVTSTSGIGGGLANIAPIGTATATLTNCTIADNSAGTGGGILNISSAGLTCAVGIGGGGMGLATLSLTDCTVTGNAAGNSGGGVSAPTGGATVQATIIAGNTAPAESGLDVSTMVGFTSAGSNLIGVGDGGLGFTNGVNNDQVGTEAAPINPGLSPDGLQDNGGPTRTVALVSGSPAIDADFSETPPATDQRGVTRPQGDRADIGAFEAVPAAADITPPVTMASLSAVSFVNGFYRGPVTVTLTATDDASGVAGTFYRVDSGPQQTYTGPFVVTGDHDHLVTFFSVDNAGNAEGPAKGAGFNIDSTPPVTEITSRAVPGGQEVTLANRDNFSGPGGTIFRVDSGPERAYTGPFLVTGNFTHLVTAYSLDRAGNAENPNKSLTFTISPPPPADTTPPMTTPALGGAPYANGFFRGAVTVTLSATDNQSGVVGTFYSVDSGPIQTYAGPFPVSGDFQHLVTFYSTDHAGNAEGPAKSITFSIDTTAPITALTHQAVAGGQQVTITATDSGGSGVASTFYSLDSGPLHAYGGPFTVTGNFTHLVSAYSVDAAGNAESPAKTLTFTVSPPADTTPPVTTPALSGVSYVNGFYRAGPVTVTLKATDNVSGVAGTFYRVDSGPLHTYAGPFPVSGDFAHLVTFYSVDNAGNAEGPAKSVTFKIDTTAPTTTGFVQSATGGRRVTLAASDNFAGVAATVYRVDSGPAQFYTGPFLVTGPSQHLVTFFSVDKAGNFEGTARSLTFVGSR